MRRRFQVGFGILLAPAAFALARCDDSSLPGTQLGTYAVTAQVQTDTCGGAQSPWTFDIQMSKMGTTLYWSWLDSRAPLSGGLNAQSSATLTASYQVNVDGTEAGLGPCWLERDDSIVVTLGAGSAPAAFTGSLSFVYSAVTGSVCTDQLASSSGPYDTLPCTMTYSLSGARQ